MSILDDLIAAEREMTAGEWVTTKWDALSHAELVRMFERHLKYSALVDFYGVGVPGHERSHSGHMVEAAMTGNGPTSLTNARGIVTLRNHNAQVIELLKYARHLVGALASKTCEEFHCQDDDDHNCGATCYPLLARDWLRKLEGGDE